MSKLKVLQLNKYYAPHIGGIERVVQQLAEGLAEETQMTVLVCAEGKKKEDSVVNGVRLIRMPRTIKLDSMPVSVEYIREFRKLAKEQDVVHLHMPFPFGDLTCLLSGYKGKLVLWWHSDVVRQKKLMLLYKPIMMKILKRADLIIVATKGHIEGSAYLKPFREKCKVVPFGVEKSVENAADSYIAESGTAIEKKGTAAVRFLFVGRFAYYKGCDVLLEAFSKVENAELYLVGSGTIEDELRAKTKEYHLENRVHFLGKISEEELCRQYASCDVFVLPSVVRSEAFGLVQIEAMAFGKPVINTNLPSGVPYVSIDGKTGLTVEPGNAGALAEAMQWMVNHEEERIRMGTAARERMKKEYRLETMRDRILKVYKELVKE